VTPPSTSLDTHDSPEFIDRRAPNRSDAIIAAALDAIISIDARGRVIEFNPAAQELFGYTRDEALGRAMEELIVPPSHRSAHALGITHYIATGEGPALNKRLELPAVRADGTELTVELIAVPVPSEDGIEFTGFIRDITQAKLLREQLAASERRYRLLLQRATRIVTVLEPDGTWRTSLGMRALGYPDDYDVDGGILTLTHPDDREKVRGAVAGWVAHTRGLDDQLDLRVRSADGSFRTMLTAGENLSSEPDIGGIVLRSWDVTEERARARGLAQAHARLQAMIASQPSAVLLEGDDGKIVLANDRFTELFWTGTSEELQNRDLLDPAGWKADVWQDPVAFRESTLALIRSGKTVVGERFETRNGRVLERDCVPVTASDGSFVGRMWRYDDITAQVRETQQLSDRNQMLEEIAVLKNQFVATVSHELRTPLTSVVSFAELLGDPDLGPLTDEQRAMLEIINRNTHRLLRLIADLLLLARLEAHTLPLELTEVSLPPLIREVTDELTPPALEAGIDLAVDVADGCTLFADRGRIHQVLANIIGNAVKYTPRGGSVMVSATGAHNGWTITVSDTGVGIPEADLPQLFEAFFRASNSQGPTGGTGLGLATSRRIIDLHGGQISVESDESVGTTVTIWLPASPPGSEALGRHQMAEV